MNRTARLAVAALLLAPVPALAAQAQPVERRGYDTRRVDAPPIVDGKLDDAAWSAVPWSSEFIQREPAEGVPPSHQTQFKVVYDDHAIYFAFRAFDDPEQVTSMLARRDRFPGDWIEVNIDSYNDRRTAFSFTLSLSGTRGDEFVSMDGGRWDGNWDPIWHGATHVDGEGWTAESRIPLSQLRFSDAENKTWGLQVQRRIFRQEERSVWQPIPKAVSGWVSQFGELRGIDGVRPRRRLEVLPYAVSKLDRQEQQSGNPFRDGSDSSLTGGVDGKLGVTSDLTLDFTLNPDFGQVEADPSEVNLTAFETFFEEKRPFFIEGADIFALPLAPAVSGGHFTSDRLFYSRRVGAPPRYSPELDEVEFADEPSNTSILGAFKLTGKTASGLSIGVMESLTAREEAQIDRLGLRRQEDVAPRTNYFAGRVQQDLRNGDTQLGLMLTNVHRSIRSEPLEFLPGTAWAGGFDFSHYFAKRAFKLEGNVLGSRLSGSEDAILGIQRSAARYFQRPDNDQADVDPTRTSLAGHAGSVRLIRSAPNSPFRAQLGAAWRSPGFEINDLGFMRRADEINQFGWATYQIRNPFSIFNRFQVNVNQWLDWDFGGNLLRKAVNSNFNANFRNNMFMNAGLTRELERLSNIDLRGGPSSLWPGRWMYNSSFSSDQRRRVYVQAGINGHHADEGSGSMRSLWMDLTARPTNALTLTLSPGRSYNRPQLQYVATTAAADGKRYLFGRLDQQTTSLTFRVDFSITPNLTLQYYGAPFISSGSYSEFKHVHAPRAESYRDRFRTFDASQVALADGEYAVDEDRDGRSDYTFGNPDFNVREFNSTLVARWEYRPGSLVYLVWSQGRADETLRSRDLSFGRGVDQLFDAKPHDVFLVKFSKWISF